MAVLEQTSERLDALFADRTTAIARDLKLNLKRALFDGSLAPEYAAPVLVALATSVGYERLAAFAVDWMVELDYPSDQIQEAQEAAALMAMLNTYYSFRDKVADASPYSAAGLRMNALARPALGKTRFEMLAFAVSVVNGCATCIGSHEQVLKQAGVTHEQLHDLARLGAIVKACKAL